MLAVLYCNHKGLSTIVKINTHLFVRCKQGSVLSLQQRHHRKDSKRDFVSYSICFNYPSFIINLFIWLE